MGKLSSLLDDLGTSYMKSEMGINEEETSRKQQKYCPNCGNEITQGSTVCYKCGVNPKNVKNKKFCPFCGKTVNEEQIMCLNCKESFSKLDDSNNVGIGTVLISFLIPLIGLIIYAVNLSTNKKLASICGKSAICGIVICLIMGFILLIGF